METELVEDHLSWGDQIFEDHLSKGTKFGGDHLFWDRLSRGTGSGGPEVQESNRFGPKCIAAVIYWENLDNLFYQKGYQIKNEGKCSNQD